MGALKEPPASAERGARPIRIRDVPWADRPSLLPVLRDSFTGIYRWHAKRTLGRIERVRAATSGVAVLGFSMLELLVPEAGYVYYVAVGSAHRRRGVGGRLLDDALALFEAGGAQVVYGAIEEENQPSQALFRSRGFREVQRDEASFREGGLGAQGLRSRMMVVRGEELFGRRLGLHRDP